jgi:hypothetical protein
MSQAFREQLVYTSLPADCAAIMSQALTSKKYPGGAPARIVFELRAGN